MSPQPGSIQTMEAGGLLRLLLLSLRPRGILSSLRHHLIVFRCAAARRCICRQPPIQCGMSAIRSPAVRSPAHDDREKHARHGRVDLIVVMARPSRIYTGVTCPCELCSPRAQQRCRERFSARQLGLACAWRCRAQGTPTGTRRPPSGVLISGLSFPRLGPFHLVPAPN